MRVQVLFLHRTVLLRLILSRFVWNLHRRVSSASLLLCMVITIHVTHIIHRIHTACMVLVVFRIRRIRGETQKLGDNASVYKGETKSLSTCTRTGVRRSAVYDFAHTQQALLKLHVETWEGLSLNQGIFREVEIVPGCAVRVACPSCPDYSPEPPGPSREIRNMLGWSQLEKTDESGVWVFRGALQGKNPFSSLDVAGDWERKGSCHTAWAVPCDSPCTYSYAYGRGPLSGHTLESGAGHC